MTAPLTLKSFQDKVLERLKRYMRSNVSHDHALELISRDFPYLDTNLMEVCDSSAFLHYYTAKSDCTDNMAAGVKKLALLHSRNLDEPFG